ncbi:hypothetical protein ACLKA7_011841 [Drosophila subpalustris]
MDETWIHHYIPESNRSSAEWREKASRWAAVPPKSSVAQSPSTPLASRQHLDVTPMLSLSPSLGTSNLFSSDFGFCPNHRVFGASRIWSES